MSGPFPFPPNVDVEAERAARGPLDRRDAATSIVVAVVGAILVAIAGVLAALELALDPDALAPIVITGVLPFAAWLAGATLALIRLVRRQRRAWIPPAVAGAVILVSGTIGTLWWLGSAGLL